MKNFSLGKAFLVGFLLLILRKIVIALFAMYIVWQRWDQVGYDQLIASPHFRSVASSLSDEKPTLVLILNKHALNMTYNWLCNTKGFEGVHENTLIVTLDDETSSELRKNWPRVAQFNWIVPGLKDPFNYGDGYYQLFYLFRANLAQALLHANKTFWMIQQDTYWDEDLLKMNFPFNDSDILFDRASEGGPLIAGGYYLARPTAPAKAYFKRLAADISWWYAPDNAYMTSLCEISGIAKCGGLPFSMITNWQWLETESEVPPKFVQFDGETKLGGKLEKMRKLGFYFLNEDRRTCNISAVEAAQRILKSKVADYSKETSYSRAQFKVYQRIVDAFYSNPFNSWLMNRFILPYAHYCMLSI